MKVFITGTDTDVGKTLICSWLCLHTGYDYFKPIQTGNKLGTDSQEVSKLTSAQIHQEIYNYKEPVSPHLAASFENDEITIDNIKLPSNQGIIIEGAGGILVPINKTVLMVDLIKKLNTPVILVARSSLGTINHTLLTIEALRSRGMPLLGVIVNGVINTENNDAIEYYGNTPILAVMPKLLEVTKQSLLDIPLSSQLTSILKG